MRRSPAKITIGLVLLASLMGSPLAEGRSKKDQERARALLKGASKALALNTARKLAALLPRLLERFRAQREELLARGGGSAYPQDGLATLLDSTESSLEKELRKSELAPMRAYVQEVFATARHDLGLSNRTAFVPPPASRVAFASFQLAPKEPAVSSARLDRSVAEPVLDWVFAFMEDLGRRAKGNDLTLDLCLVSVPDGAVISLHVKGEKEIYKEKTDAPLRNLFRGKYVYQARKGKVSIECEDCSADLWDKRQPVLNCNFDERLCLVREGWPKSCRGR